MNRRQTLGPIDNHFNGPHYGSQQQQRYMQQSAKHSRKSMAGRPSMGLGLPSAPQASARKVSMAPNAMPGGLGSLAYDMNSMNIGSARYVYQ